MIAIEVARVAGYATVQDRGRPGHMHEGVPPGGALVPEWLARANARAGNAPGAAAIELVGSIDLVARGGAVLVATESGEARSVGEGEALRVQGRSDRRVQYVAVRGGLDVPAVLGGRGSLVVAGIGAPLKKGDRILVTPELEDVAPHSLPEEDRLALTAPIRVRLGPDLARFSAEAASLLCSSSFVVSPSSDRTGTRLRGPALPRLDRDDAESAPMVAGALEVPASGDPIVLGPDHPTTGGYPVLAVVLRADLGRFHALPLGGRVTFAKSE